MGSGSGAEKKQTPPCKSGRGTCSAHYIREDVLRELVLERIRAVNELIREDAEGFQEEWLCCRRADQEKSIRNDRREQKQLKAKVAESEDWLKKQQDMSDGIDNFLALTRKYVDVEELTQTIVNEYIKADRHVCAGQIQRPPAAEDQDYLQLCRLCGTGRCQ